MLLYYPSNRYIVARCFASGVSHAQKFSRIAAISQKADALQGFCEENQYKAKQNELFSQYLKALRANTRSHPTDHRYKECKQCGEQP
jgi:hypothetical protein